MEWMIKHGDCIDVMRTMKESSVDSIVTDPPYELGFMGKRWDASGITYNVNLWREALRILKPGGHLLAFGGTRTYHRMACAIEDAGFEIRDSIDWIYGQGFPKSLDVSKAIDKMMGAEREPTGEVRTRHGGGAVSEKIHQLNPDAKETPITAPATDAAKRFEGWGTALKPAHEPIVVARKPLSGTVAETVLKHGTGALNVDGCRVETTDNLNGGAYAEGGGRSTLPGDAREGAALGMLAPGKTAGRDFVQPAGRWPPNVLLAHAPECRQVGTQTVKRSVIESKAEPSVNAFGDGLNGSRCVGYAEETVPAWECTPGCPVAMMDTQSGELKAGVAVEPNDRKMNRSIYGATNTLGRRITFADSGGASRFFPTFTFDPQIDAPFLYCAKASKKDRGGTANTHPTVKPVVLMRWLVRLVTPPNGVIVDPFVGSGTTIVAAILEGFHALGIEREETYVEIANARINAAIGEPKGDDLFSQQGLDGLGASP